MLSSLYGRMPGRILCGFILNTSQFDQGYMEMKKGNTKSQLAYSYLFGLIIFFCALSEVMASSSTVTLSDAQIKAQYEQAKNLIHTYAGDGDNMQQAVALADDIRQAAPQSPYSYLIVAELMFIQYKNNGDGDPGEIWALTDRIISLDSRIASTYVIRSKLSLIAGDNKRAQSEANHAIALDPKNREAMFAKAQVEEALNHFRQAKGWYLKTINAHTDPDRKSNIYFWLAQMYLKMTPPQVSKADEFMNKSADFSPHAPWKLVNYAIFLNTSVGNYKKAAEYALRALDIMEFPMGRLHLGMARYGMWATEFSQARNHSFEDFAKAKTDVEAIVNETGISPAEAFQYASQYMSQSKISNSLISAGILIPAL